ncbi:hypothetical protein [Virgibacillus ndiopensis]|uniref:hypothetical protein n=1 Tax=Virgibacillus ndiopensis TaxID=2004408 RepID=UPI000C0848D9|nr:hypothetical protein [Virgibacillus ndiopensis]
MKKILLYILLFLLVTIVASFLLGYSKFGFTVGFIFILVAIGAANIFQMKNTEYLHHKLHDSNVRRNKR